MILIVDDEPSALIMLEMVLQREGFVVCKARSGREALRLLEGDESQNCVLVLTDIRMPVMGGRELVARMRADPRLTRIPVIMVTSTTDRSTVVELLGQGVRDYIVKPVKAQIVMAKVRAVLANEERVLEPRGETIERLAMSGLDYGPLADATALTLDIIECGMTDALRTHDAGAVRAAAEQAKGPATVFGANRVATAAHCVLMASNDPEALRLAAILVNEIGELRSALQRVGSTSRA